MPKPRKVGTPWQRIHAAKERLGDIKAIHTRWYSGQDRRSMDEIMSEIESLVHSTRCYLDGIPGVYLPDPALKDATRAASERRDARE